MTESVEHTLQELRRLRERGYLRTSRPRLPKIDTASDHKFSCLCSLCHLPMTRGSKNHWPQIKWPKADPAKFEAVLAEIAEYNASH